MGLDYDVSHTFDMFDREASHGKTELRTTECSTAGRIAAQKPCTASDEFSGGKSLGMTAGNPVCTIVNTNKTGYTTTLYIYMYMYSQI